MACTAVTLSGIPLDCGNIGGIKNVWLINDNALVVSELGGELWIGYNSDKTLAQYSFRKGNASMTSTGNKDDKMGTYFVKTDLNLSFNKMDRGNREDIEKISKTNCYAIVEDNNGIYHLLGKESYIALTTVNGQSGALMSDANQYSLVLSSDTKELPDIISDRSMTLMTQYDMVWGGTIQNGDYIFLEIDVLQPFATTGINEYAYFKGPDNVILSGSPIVAPQYSGEPGSVIYYIPKTSTNANFNAVDGIDLATMRGAINTNRVNKTKFHYNSHLTSVNAPLCKEVYVTNCTNLSYLKVSPRATYVRAYQCALTASVIGDILRNAFIEDIINFSMYVSNGTNANFFTGPNSVEIYLNATYGMDLSTVLNGILGYDGVIIFNN